MKFKKITENVENISTLPDKPQLSATDIKAEFDKGSKIIKEYFNDQVDDLNTFQDNLEEKYFKYPQRNIVVGDNLDSQMLHFDFSNLTYEEMTSEQYLVYADSNHYIETIAKTSSLAGIDLKDGSTYIPLFRINEQNIITTNETEYKASNTFAVVTSILSSASEYEKITLNNTDVTFSTNDFTDEYKDEVDNNTISRHEHENKTVLDSVSASDITNWNSKQPAGDYANERITNLEIDALF